MDIRWLARRPAGVLIAAGMLGACWLPGSGLAARMSEAYEVKPRPLPEFHSSAAQDWINTPPLTRAGLRGKVLLLEFWTTS